MSRLLKIQTSPSRGALYTNRNNFFIPPENRDRQQTALKNSSRKARGDETYIGPSNNFGNPSLFQKAHARISSANIYTLPACASLPLSCVLYPPPCIHIYSQQGRRHNDRFHSLSAELPCGVYRRQRQRKRERED